MEQQDQQHISNFLITTEKKELQQIEQKPLKTGRVALAVKRSPLIQNSHNEDLEAMLKFVMMKVGIRANNLPSKVEKQVLVDHIKKYYPVNTLDEIRLAFELAMNDELDLNPDDIKHYENFSCMYFSRIMSAYQVFAANEYKMINEPPPPQKIYTDEENDNLHRELTEQFYQRLRNGSSEQLPDYVREILLKDNYIRTDQSATAFFVFCLGRGVEKIYEQVKDK